MPQPCGCSGFIRFPLREADELELHTPRAFKIDPGLALAVASTLGGLAHNLDLLALEVSERRVEIIHIEGQVMSTDIGILRLWRLTISGLVLKDFEVRSELAAEEPQLAHNGTRVDAQVFGHPIVLADKGPKAVDQLAADDIDEEPLCLIEVRDGKADVLGAS